MAVVRLALSRRTNRTSASPAGGCGALSGARQKRPVPSEPSAATGRFTLPAPSVTSVDGTLQAYLEDADADGAADDLAILLDGTAGLQVVVSVDGSPTGRTHLLTGTPLERVVYDATPGDHVIGIRYVDPQTARLGRLATFTITALAPLA